MAKIGEILILLTVLMVTKGQDTPTVYTPLGEILGAAQTSRKGFKFYSFRGIRYAEAPIDALRFKPPVPVKPWTGIFNATADGPACHQYLNMVGAVSEDCLRINVYTRRLSDNELRPVLVFIHGGAFSSLSGQSFFYGPDYLLDHDIVLVTLNYRLGSLGFFSSGDKYASGNYGLKDQVQALRWVRDNIRYFGGNPNKVTISGESAGAASVGLHLVSHMSRGLFHGAIDLSGGTANFWAVNKNPIPLAKKQASLLNCSTDDSGSMVSCLRTRSADQIAGIYPFLAEWNIWPIITLSPVIESEDDEEPFLTKDPVAALLEGDIADVPVFIGATKDEMAILAHMLLQNKDWASDLSKNWNKIAPILFLYEPNDQISTKLREYYMGSVDVPITENSEAALGELFTDAGIIFGVVRSAKLIADKNTKSVYLYRFSYEGKHRAVYFPESVRNVPGVFHGDDLIYLFYGAPFTPLFGIDTDDGRCVDRFTTLVKNFVETGNPNPEPSRILNNVTWTPYTTSNPSYLEISKNLTSINGIYFKDRISFLESLYPLKK